METYSFDVVLKTEDYRNVDEVILVEAEDVSAAKAKLRSIVLERGFVGYELVNFRDFV